MIYVYALGKVNNDDWIKSYADGFYLQIKTADSSFFPVFKSQELAS